MDVQFITLLIRWSVVLLMLLCAYEFWRTTVLIANPLLKIIVGKMAVGVFIFAIARLIASLLDNNLEFGIGIFSNIVNYAFWFWVLYHLHRNRKRVGSEALGATGRQRLSDAIGVVIAEMDSERKHRVSI